VAELEHTASIRDLLTKHTPLASDPDRANTPGAAGKCRVNQWWLLSVYRLGTGNGVPAQEVTFGHAIPRFQHPKRSCG
jgi:hypothetical protein